MKCETGKVENVLIDDHISRIWTMDGQIWQKRVGGIRRRITPGHLSRIMPVRGLLESCQ